MLKSYCRLLFKILSFACPLALIAFPVAMVIGTLMPWAPADALLKQRYDEQAVMVGGQYTSKTSAPNTGGQTSEHWERTYVLIPSVLHDPKLVVISQDDDQALRLMEDSGGALMLPVAMALFAFGTWWFWLRKPGNTGAGSRLPKDHASGNGVSDISA